MVWKENFFVAARKKIKNAVNPPLYENILYKKMRQIFTVYK